MILSGKEIAAKQGNEIKIMPFDPKRVNPNSYNLRLHNELLVYDEPVLDMKKYNKYHTITIPADGLVLEPGKLYLGRTAEYTETHGYVPMLEGRSSVGRLGLCIHVTAGFGDVGFKGYWTLELFCLHPIRIYPNTEICQIYYHEISKDHEEYLSGKYQENKGIQPSMMWKDWETPSVTIGKETDVPTNAGCDFCRENWADKTCDGGGSYDFRLSQNTLYYCDSQFGWEGIDVKYCPICGRELEEQA